MTRDKLIYSDWTVLSHSLYGREEFKNKLKDKLRLQTEEQVSFGVMSRLDGNLCAPLLLYVAQYALQPVCEDVGNI